MSSSREEKAVPGPKDANHSYHNVFNPSGPESSLTHSLGNFHPVRKILSVRPTQEYEQLRPDLLHAMKPVNGKWMMLEAVVDGEASVAVIVEGNDTTVDLKHDVSTRISDLAKAAGFRAVVANGELRFWSPPVSAELGQNMKYQRNVDSGASVGVAGMQWSGSFGCYLENMETKEVLGLTCAHNIAVNGIPNPGEPDVDLLELYRRGASIIQPSDPDRRNRIIEVQSAIEDQMDFMDLAAKDEASRNTTDR